MKDVLIKKCHIISINHFVGYDEEKLKAKIKINSKTQMHPNLSLKNLKLIFCNFKIGLVTRLKNLKPIFCN